MGPKENRQEIYRMDQFYCLGPEQLDHYHESLGEALLGLELVHAGMLVRFKQETRAVLCEMEMNDIERNNFKYAIRYDYIYQNYVDNLPVWGHVGFVSNLQFMLYTSRHYEIHYNQDQIIRVTLTKYHV